LSKDELAVVQQYGKGDGPSGPPPSSQRPRYKRRLSNLLLDKRLQLRYVLLVTILSAAIAGTLGYMIFNQMHLASDDVVNEFLANAERDKDDPESRAMWLDEANDMRGRDRDLILKMAGVGVGLVVILSLYLVIMTHKVAGPLHKVTLYFDKMTAGKLGHVTPLRKGDMLTDFYDGFRDMHGAVRSRLQADLGSMQKFLDACQAAGVDRGDALGKEIEKLEKHATERKTALS
jgi:hypothetical protein